MNKQTQKALLSLSRNVSNLADTVSSLATTIVKVKGADADSLSYVMTEAARAHASANDLSDKLYHLERKRRDKALKKADVTDGTDEA